MSNWSAAGTSSRMYTWLSITELISRVPRFQLEEKRWDVKQHPEDSFISSWGSEIQIKYSVGSSCSQCPQISRRKQHNSIFSRTDVYYWSLAARASQRFELDAICLQQYGNQFKAKFIDVSDAASFRSVRLRWRHFHYIWGLETAWHYHVSAVLVGNRWIMREEGKEGW